MKLNKERLSQWFWIIWFFWPIIYYAYLQDDLWTWIVIWLLLWIFLSKIPFLYISIKEYVKSIQK